MKCYTVAIATRLKRKIFRAGMVADFFEKILTVRISENGLLLRSCKLLDYGAILEIESENDLSEHEISKLIRYGTSKVMRDEFAELWSLPSLWTRHIYFSEGRLDSKKQSEIDEFYESVKTR